MFAGICIAIAIFIWAFVGIYSLGLLPKDIAKHFDDPAERVAWLLRGFAWLCVVIGILLPLLDVKFTWFDLWPELVGIGITVLIIDSLNQRRSELELKKRLFLQIRFSSNAFALDALQLVRNLGWIDEIIRPEANLNRAHLEEANLYGAQLAGADLRNACLDRADLRTANLTAANLEDASLKGAWLDEANFDDAILVHANFEDANMKSVSLKGANLLGAHLNRASLVSSDLQGAELTGSDLQNTDIHDANLQDTNLSSAHLMKAILWRSNLARAILVSTNLENAELGGANLQKTDLYRANFKDAHLGSTDLRSAALDRADFEGAILSETILDRAVYTTRTRWPHDFDFKAAGAVTRSDLTDEEKKEHNINRPAAWHRKWLAKAANHPWRIR